MPLSELDRISLEDAETALRALNAWDGAISRERRAAVERANSKKGGR